MFVMFGPKTGPDCLLQLLVEEAGLFAAALMSLHGLPLSFQKWGQQLKACQGRSFVLQPWGPSLADFGPESSYRVGRCFNPSCVEIKQHLPELILFFHLFID